MTLGGFVFAAITLPANVGSVGPSIRAWRNLLADVGGAPLQNLVFYAAVTVGLLGIFGPPLYKHFRAEATPAAPEPATATKPPRPSAPKATAGPAATPFVIATEREAALAKANKWIKRGEQLEGRFPKLPTNDEIAAMSNEEKETHIGFLQILHVEERRSIGEWHEGVSRDLLAVGGGTLGLYSADEKPSAGMFSIARNREFLRERLQELQAIRSRLEPDELPPEPEPQRLPTRRPKIEPSIAPAHAAQAHLLLQEAQPLIDEAWNLALRTRRRIGFEMLGDEFVAKVREWNGRVLDLADKTLSVKERAQVRSLSSGIARGISSMFMSAQQVEDLVNDNMQTLRTIEKRCLQRSS